jgi:hypothetical protein
VRDELLPVVGPDKFAIAGFSWRKPLAEGALRACDPLGRGFIAELREFPEPWD